LVREAANAASSPNCNPVVTKAVDTDPYVVDASIAACWAFHDEDHPLSATS
jgi:hypothetical protein